MSQDEYTLDELRDQLAKYNRMAAAERTTGSERRTLKWEIANLERQIAERGDSK